MLSTLSDGFQVLLHDVDGVIDLLRIMESVRAFDIEFACEAERSGRIDSLLARSRKADSFFLKPEMQGQLCCSLDLFQKWIGEVILRFERKSFDLPIEWQPSSGWRLHIVLRSGRCLPKGCTGRTAARELPFCLR